ncbi:Adiponectin receptor protein 2 [Monoraphidium neglectum]|uniref:Adiponectin receptor protein 2 n=1 Tax=Monoraphidium neglectum TaxID=145388 RepID=A0A0D2LSQ1_9CHLO|nr:Adiponectin receptor protein 2 [Monoraphidium neglectum]KIY92811.1 Adiponectin receptor protein 2 [Monoraphidium neglectum]|eukprot:XP_013891831.1 Adiponectin receptor protein 2 [Monoraphidium neglectum]
MPRWPVYVYFAGACVCLLTSCVCHLLGCCQRHISQVVWRFDYAGIAVLIVASFYPAVYYAFLCQPFWRNFYLITTTVAGASVIAVSLPNTFQATEYRTLRAAVFSGLGLWGIVPVAHQLVWYWDVWAIRTAFKLDLLMGALYLVGAAIYASRVPERWLPGKLDLIGHSHQLWHVAVVLAALVHYKAILVLLQWRDASGGCAAHLPAHVPTVLATLRAGGGGAEALGIEQVWRHLDAQLHRFVGVPAAAAPLPVV